jgi:hypothetical protein
MYIGVIFKQFRYNFPSRFRIDELSRLNYSKDVELQKQRQQMEALQIRMRQTAMATAMSPAKAARMSQHSPEQKSPVLHL